MNFAQLEHFDPKDPGKIIMADNDPTEGSFVADELLEGDRYKPRARKRYHYNIGKYEESTYYCQFLSDKLIRLPSGRSATVREMTEQLSLKPHSMFRSWFRMTLYKVVEIADCFILAGWVGLSHHCRQRIDFR